MKGIINTGNICFINSLLQILFQILPNEVINALMNIYDLKNKYNMNENIKLTPIEICEQELFLEFLNLYSHKNDPNGQVIIPTKFVSKLQKLAKLKNNEDLSISNRENDVNEFFIFLFDCIHNIFKRSNTINNTIFYNISSEHTNICTEIVKHIKTSYLKEYSEIYELFGGIQLSLIKSPIPIASQPGLIKTSRFINPLLNVKSDFYTTIDLYIPPNAETLIECLNTYIREETLDGDNAWFNEKTGEKESIIKQSAFWSFPKILVINLKRAATVNNKNRQYINYPVTDLNLSVYALNKYCKYIYDLYGVCNHHGHTRTSGHYTSYVKEFDTSKWYSCNDMAITEINESQLVTPNACMLFYVKK